LKAALKQFIDGEFGFESATHPLEDTIKIWKSNLKNEGRYPFVRSSF